MGRLFHSLGLLATADVVECSASDLVTGYAGQAAGKTRQVFDRAVGGVLFVDEAYRWARVWEGRGRGGEGRGGEGGLRTQAQVSGPKAPDPSSTQGVRLPSVNFRCGRWAVMQRTCGPVPLVGWRWGGLASLKHPCCSTRIALQAQS